MNPLSERLLGGDTLFTVMSPDTDVDHTAPDHLEGFEMSPCVVRSTHIWGVADTILAGPDARKDRGGVPVHFYYSDMRNFYTTGNFLRGKFDFARKDIRFTLFTQKRYKLHEFHAVADYSMVWNSEMPTPSAKLEAVLERGRRLKVAVEVEEGMWLVNRVGHATQECDGAFVFMAIACPLPRFIFAERADYDAIQPLEAAESLPLDTEILQAGVSVSTGGWLRGRAERAAVRAWLSLRIFEQRA